MFDEKSSPRGDFLTQRCAGVLLHISSLAGSFGIGEMGAHARAFIDQLREMQFRVWQVLPLGPTGFANSPYQSFSVFAGNEMLIDMQQLIDDGLLQSDELETLRQLPEHRVDYIRLNPLKSALLDIASRRFMAHASHESFEQLTRFVLRHDHVWLDDYALFRTLKSKHGESAWIHWDENFARRDSEAIAQFRADNLDEILRVKVRQFWFFQQWQALKNYAQANGISLFGDLPIYIAHDSADAWASPEILALDEHGNAKFVAGVPPDYFSDEGQRWGNPLYDWEAMKDSGYQWWVERLSHMLKLFDVVRIDHFRAIESYWSIPAQDETAINGSWINGPGDDFLRTLDERLGNLPVVAEDLGIITDAVTELRERHKLPGMVVLQFLLDQDDFDISRIAENSVCYSGTHDNDTTRGWFRRCQENASSSGTDNDQCERILRNTRGNAESIHADVVRLALESPARMVVIPLQDLLGLDSDARMNTPGKIDGNWAWRHYHAPLSDQRIGRLREMLKEAGRA